MRNASALAARLAETVTDALTRASERLLDLVGPQRQAQLIPVRVRRRPPHGRR
ncbi:hypothetical protein [Methylobacterium gregans]|uniref:Uncharacterized protein n=1 Tax=Methylobacterium gregans TaxID=374424 RepID=A0AA37HK57_9HYPH|nr:hypothetical protein [Methylobacterium gregans]MDQ0521744.1 hypothetical protein [Methylobacterium gregans]GJD77095.1 hypothetical protein NBEOAGPD_0297 [Methylobacterium gregans]GLS55007.1 hypothetical protein GCM10007886_31910 [Methylobacterium gregans]